MANSSSNNVIVESPPAHEGPVERLLSLTASAGHRRSTDGCFFAQVPVGGRRETHALRSPAFHDWLIDGYLRDSRRVPSDWSIRRVLGVLEATARFGGGTPSIFVRVGHDGNSSGNGSASFGRSLGWPAGTALLDYGDNRREATRADVEDSPLGKFLLAHANDETDWSRTPADLLDELNASAGKAAASPGWPKSPQRLSVELRRIAAQLRAHDISVTFERNRDCRRMTVANVKPWKKISSHVSSTDVETCVADECDGKNTVTRNSNPSNDVTL